MRRPTVWTAVATGLCVLAAGCRLIGKSDRDTAPPIGATGLSVVGDPFQAGRQAAALAASVTDRPACVLVLDSFPAVTRNRVLAGVKSRQAGEVLFGCSASAVVASGAPPTGSAVAAVALGAPGLTAATPITTIDRSNPRLSGEMLARALPKKEEASLLLVFADCPVPVLAELVAGIKQIKGADLPIVGITASGSKPAVYFKGASRQGVLAGVALRGPMAVATVSRSAGSAKAHTAASVTASARDAAAALLAELGGSPELVLVFSAVERRAALSDPSGEVNALLEVLGEDVPVIGCYGNAQIGPPRTGMPALALERHIVLCGIRRPSEP